VKPCADAYFDVQQQPTEPASVSAARCILEKLRDRVVGTYYYRGDTQNTGIPGQYALQNFVNVLPDGTAVDWSIQSKDSAHQSDAVHITIESKAYFDDCLAKSDAELYGCLTSWHAAPANQCPVCPVP
jgi:hypothetical protein